MKNLKRNLLIVTCVACVIAFTPALMLSAKDPAPTEQTPEDKDQVKGKVAEKTEKSFKVDKQTIAVTELTKFTKDGKPIQLKDVIVGDTVEVKVAKGADGSLVAKEVKVIPRTDEGAK